MRRLLLSLIALVSTTATFGYTPTEDGMYAVFDTSKGEFVVILAYDAVPLTVANFVGLAEGSIPWSHPDSDAVRTDPLYDGTLFYQVVPGRHIWAGDPAQKGDGKTNPGYTIPQEMHPNLIPTRGAIVMYNLWAPKEDEYVDIGENTAGSEFFILAQDQEAFDGRYATFGYVVEGMDIVDEIASVAVDSNTGKPTTDIVIHSITIVRQGAEAEAFSVADYQLPKLLPTPLQVDRQPDAPSLAFTAESGASYLVRTSSDLQTWEEEMFEPGNAAQQRSVDFAQTLAENDAAFAEVSQLELPVHTDTVAGATFTVDLFGLPHGGLWTHTFNAGGLDDEETYGPVTIGGITAPTSIRDYGFHHLPSGGRLKVVTNNGYVITYFLRFTSATEGGAFAWVEYLPHNLRFASTGSFTLSPRP